MKSNSQIVTEGIMKKPITPSQAIKLKAKGTPVSIPEQVFEAFNELIIKNLSGSYSKFLQKDVAILIKSKMGLEKTDIIYDNHWLDVEEIYKKQGWKVEYDKPGYCESYDASFTFSHIK